MDQSIFKAYDIRGIYPQELNEKTAFDIGAAFARFAGAAARRAKYTKAKNIIVGEDARKSSPALRDALVKGIISTSANVILAGCATTPLFYFAVATAKDADAGIMVTASHNPAKYNGFKLVWGDATPISPSSILPLIKGEEGGGRGKITKINVLNAYVKKVLSLIDTKKIKPMKIVIDAGNGTAGITVEKLLKKLPQIKTKKLLFDIDMSFPNHEANPMKEENLALLKAMVKKEKANLGVAYDGDADRIGFVDEKGNSVRADFIFAAILPELFACHPKSTALYDLRSSKVISEIIKEFGGKPRMTRVGHAFIKKDMTKYKATAAAELSAHYYFKDFFDAECSDLVMLYILKILSAGKSLSQIIAPMQKYFQSGEINFEVRDKDAVIADILKRYRKDAKNFTNIDGVRMEFSEGSPSTSSGQPQGDWFWFSVRASNTEPLLRLNIEANNKELLTQKTAELTKIIKK